MKEIQTRNKFTKIAYKKFLKPILFKTDPEIAHNLTTKAGKFLGSNPLTRKAISKSYNYQNKALKQKILGIEFTNPIGLSAGFDKNAELTKIIPEVGFGFMELGSITGEPCKGNPKPRLWRLKTSEGLIVYYGLKNKGAEIISKNLKNSKFKIPVGTSIAKTNSKETITLKAGIEDYVKAFKCFTQIGSYFTINISCPNAFGGQPFTKPEYLKALLTEIDKIPTKKPIFIKLSPDLEKSQIDKILKIIDKHRIHGIICSNLTKNRENKQILEKNIPKKGGISGQPLKDISNNLISYVYKKTKGKYIIIGVGGVKSADDAYEKIKSGASLIQLITGMIYEGPQLISQINQDLVKLLKNDGFNNINEATGANLLHKSL